MEKDKLLEKYNLNPRVVSDYFSLDVVEQVGFLNNCFSLNISNADIEIILGCSWTKITDLVRPLYRKDKRINRYIKKDLNGEIDMDIVEELKKEIEDLKKDINSLKCNKNNQSNLLLDVDVKLCKETILKQFKIDKNISERFDKFAELYPILNKQVLVSLALKQFMCKYLLEDKEN